MSLKNDGEKWSTFFYFEIHQAPSEIPANLLGQFGHSGQVFLHWAAATLTGLGEFQNKKSRQLFTIIFKQKNCNFKTQDFSPLIKRVLAGV